MNTRNSKAKFKNFRILLEILCRSTIVMGRIINKLHHEKDAQVQRNTQAGNSITNIKVKIDFTLPALSATNVVTWKCHVDDSAKGRYDVSIGQDLLSELGLNLKFS